MLNKKTAVLLWLYHNDLDREFFDLLYPLQPYVDVYLALCKDNKNSHSINLFNTMNNIKEIKFMDNCGADIIPFLKQLNSISASHYDYFFKIHTKKSQWGHNFVCNWRAMLLDNLLGSEKIFLDNMDYIKRTKKDMYGCKPLLYNQDDMSEMHSDKINELMEVLNFNDSKKHFFFGGNMFAGKTSLYKQYFNIETLRKITRLLSKEKGKIDEKPGGTYCHAMERIFGYFGSQNIGYLNKDYICIKNSDPVSKKSHQYLDFTVMYNKDIYCIQQPSLYGSIKNITDDTLEIYWAQPKQTTQYRKIRKNIYVNSLHMHAGV